MSDLSQFMNLLPWDLKGFGRARLEKLPLEELRALCAAREVLVDPLAGKDACVPALLNWKDAEAAKPKSGTACGDGDTRGPPEAVSRDVPWDLKGFARSRLEQLDPHVLRDLCSARKLEPRRDNELAGQLLEWKAEQASRRAGRPARRESFMEHDHGEWRARLKHLVRESVSAQRSELWQRRQPGSGTWRPLCAYTLRPLALEGRAHEPNAPEVDHIFECQAMGDCLFRTEAMRPVLLQMDWTARHFQQQPEVVQSALGHVRSVQNTHAFLAVCGSRVNKKKQGGFQRCLHALEDGELEHGLHEALRQTFANPKLDSPFEEAEAARVASTVARAVHDLEDPLVAALRDVPRGIAQGRDQQSRYDGLADEIVQMFDALGVTQRV